MYLVIEYVDMFFEITSHCFCVWSCIHPFDHVPLDNENLTRGLDPTSYGLPDTYLPWRRPLWEPALVWLTQNKFQYWSTCFSIFPLWNTHLSLPWWPESVFLRCEELMIEHKKTGLCALPHPTQHQDINSHSSSLIIVHPFTHANQWLGQTKYGNKSMSSASLSSFWFLSAFWWKTWEGFPYPPLSTEGWVRASVLLNE